MIIFLWPRTFTSIGADPNSEAGIRVFLLWSRGLSRLGSRVSRQLGSFVPRSIDPSKDLFGLARILPYEVSWQLWHTFWSQSWHGYCRQGLSRQCCAALGSRVPTPIKRINPLTCLPSRIYLIGLAKADIPLSLLPNILILLSILHLSTINH